LLYLIPQLNKSPRGQKFVLGDRIETKLLDVQEFCLRAYYSRDKRGHLLEANLQLEVARHQVRLAHALKLFAYSGTRRMLDLPQAPSGAKSLQPKHPFISSAS
jgi:hypothetical protein